MSNYATTGPLDVTSAFHAAQAARDWSGWLRDRLPLRFAMHVLDAGCGTGALWRGAVPPGADLTLLDSSAAMLSEAGAALAHLRPAIVEADLGTGALPRGPFDLVVAAHVLHHMRDPGAVIDRLRRRLAPGGALAVTMIGGGTLPIVGALLAGLHGVDPTRAVRERFPPDLAASLLAGRFATVVRHDLADRYRIVDAGLLAGYDLSFPPGPDLADDAREAIRERVADRIAAAGGSLDADVRAALLIAGGGPGGGGCSHPPN